MKQVHKNLSVTAYTSNHQGGSKKEKGLAAALWLLERESKKVHGKSKTSGAQKVLALLVKCWAHSILERLIHISWQAQ